MFEIFTDNGQHQFEIRSSTRRLANSQNLWSETFGIANTFYQNKTRKWKNGLVGVFFNGEKISHNNAPIFHRFCLLDPRISVWFPSWTIVDSNYLWKKRHNHQKNKETNKKRQRTWQRQKIRKSARKAKIKQNKSIVNEEIFRRNDTVSRNLETS